MSERDERLVRLETIIQQHERRLEKLENDIDHIKKAVSGIKADMSWVRRLSTGTFLSTLAIILTLISLLAKLFGG